MLVPTPEALLIGLQGRFWSSRPIIAHAKLAMQLRMPRLSAHRLPCDFIHRNSNLQSWVLAAAAWIYILLSSTKSGGTRFYPAGINPPEIVRSGPAFGFYSHWYQKLRGHYYSTLWLSLFPLPCACFGCPTHTHSLSGSHHATFPIRGPALQGHLHSLHCCLAIWFKASHPLQGISTNTANQQS